MSRVHLVIRYAWENRQRTSGNCQQVEVFATAVAALINETEEYEREGGIFGTRIALKEAVMDFDGNSLPHELLVAVLNRLSSRPLAAAACVCHNWRKAAMAVNSTPFFFSALSYLPQLEEAFDAVLRDVLGAPFWPDFAIVFAGASFELSQVSALVKRRLPEKMPLIACISAGIAGRDTATGENIEVIFNGELGSPHQGLVLAVGRFPGVHVKALKLHNAHSVRDVESFIDAASTVPYEGHAPVSPFAMLLLGDPKSHPSTFLETLEKAYGGKSIIVGGLANFLPMEGGSLLAHSAVNTFEEENSSVKGGQIRRRSQHHAEKDDVNCSEKDTWHDFVALVFTEDRDGISSNETSTKRVQCRVIAAGGLKAVGPVYKVVSVRDTKDSFTEEMSTQISCEREGLPMDGFAVLEDIDTEIHGAGIPPNHIGIFRKQKRPNQLPHFSLHELQASDEEYLFISGRGVKTRDSFRFYQLDPVAARKSLHEALSTATNHITGAMDTDCNRGSAVAHHLRSAHLPTKQVIGGILFGCAGRGHEFFGESNVESYAFQQRLPGVPMAGMFDLAEFGPPAFLPGSDEEDEVAKGKAIENFFSSMFVLFHT